MAKKTLARYKRFKPGDWVEVLSYSERFAGWRINRVSRIVKWSQESEPRIYLRRWNKSRQRLNKTETWRHASEIGKIDAPRRGQRSRCCKCPTKGRRSAKRLR